LSALMSETTAKSVAKSKGNAIACFAFPETPARVLGALARYAEWRDQPLGCVPEFADIDFSLVRGLCSRALETHGPGWLDGEAVRQLLPAAHLPAAPSGVAHNEDEVAELASRLEFPVAIKLVSRRLVHKTEVGGVQLNIRDAEQARRAFRTIR